MGRWLWPFALTCLLVAPVHAGSGTDRDGLVLGMSISVGFLQDEDAFGPGTDTMTEVQGGFELQSGFMFSSRLGVLYSGSFLFGRYLDWALFNNVNTVAIQIFPTRALWLRAGVGFGVTSVTGDDYDTSRIGLGLLAALGWELLQLRHMAFDVRASLMPQYYRSEEGGWCTVFTVGFGSTWY